MENRNLIVTEYFKLRVLLNRTNLVRDTKTEMIFEIIKLSATDYRLIATLRGIKSPKYIELCKTTRGKTWVTPEHSGLFVIEEFCRDFLEKRKSSLVIYEDFKDAAKVLLSELQSLGISL